jgi:hypothetical protein
LALYPGIGGFSAAVVQKLKFLNNPNISPPGCRAGGKEQSIHKRLSQNFSFWESNRKIRGFARLKA